jgi:hypothetical protein
LHDIFAFLLYMLLLCWLGWFLFLGLSSGTLDDFTLNSFSCLVFRILVAVWKMS